MLYTMDGLTQLIEHKQPSADSTSRLHIPAQGEEDAVLCEVQHPGPIPTVLANCLGQYCPHGAGRLQ